jgi:hypothetical protein
VNNSLSGPDARDHASVDRTLDQGNFDRNPLRLVFGEQPICPPTDGRDDVRQIGGNLAPDWSLSF